MNRRGFLARLFAAPIVALAVLRTPISHDWVNDLKSFAPPAGEGISIRFISQFDATAGQVNRFDVLYGVATLNPEFMGRVTEERSLWWSLRRWLAA